MSEKERPRTSPKAAARSPEASLSSLLPRRTGLFGAARMDAVNAERSEVAESLKRRLLAMRKASGDAAVAAPVLPSGRGAALPDAVRARIEPQLGAKLDDARIHAGGDSSKAASDLGAKAFTVGNDVHFNAGQFAPGTKEGDRLLAHELTHVVQGQRSRVHRKAGDDSGAADGHGAVDVSHPNDTAEKEADAVGDRVANALHEPQKANVALDAGTRAPAEKAAAISAKFIGVGTKLHRAKAPDSAAKASPATATGTATGAATMAAPGQPDLQTACQHDAVAKQKYLDVMSETQPRASAVRSKFVAEATKALAATPNDPLGAMRSVVRKGGYFFLGNEIPEKELANAGGVSRVVDLKTIHSFYLDPSFVEQYRTPDKFYEAAYKGHFDPVRHIDDRKSMLGARGVKETWWFPTGEANAVDLEGLREQLYIKDNPDYANGAVRCDMAHEAIQQIGVKLFKPTAFDGMMQGWGSDPWWVTKPGPWGITKNDTHEAVTKSRQWRFYKARQLVKPPTLPTSGKADTGGVAKPQSGAVPNAAEKGKGKS